MSWKCASTHIVHMRNQHDWYEVRGRGSIRFRFDGGDAVTNVTNGK